MKNEFKEFLLNLVISAFIGLIIGLVEIAVMHMTSEYSLLIVRDVLLGASIGTVSRYLFLLLYVKKQSLFLCLSAVFFIIGVLAVSPGIFFVINGEHPSMFMILSIVVVAEILGLGFSYFSYLRCEKINEKLREKQKELKQQHTQI